MKVHFPGEEARVELIPGRWFRLRLRSAGNPASRCRCRSSYQVMASVVWLHTHVTTSVCRVIDGLLLCRTLPPPAIAGCVMGVEVRVRH